MNTDHRAVYELKSQVFGRLCLKVGLTPNVLTAISLIFSVAAGVVLWSGNFIMGSILILLTAFADVLDGATARAGNIGTVYGSILDHVSDRYAEFFILAGILLSQRVHAGWALFALFGMVIASYTRAAAESIGKIESCEVGAVGRTGKFIFILSGLVGEELLPGYYILAVCLALVGVISYITSIQRLIFARRRLDEKDRSE
ncbi:MAG: CDP-alcohol phosphatidyltransferase family protein [candidate division Zixibacteria bacterium]|nr:CDP-alcohol phosphatidyltransferase family protein [candidate division Zixibacteria bacterium]